MAQEPEHRREERVRAAMRVDLGGNGTGVTRDVSASGIFFETQASFTDGAAISFSIEIDTPGGKMVLNCQGNVVRVERRDSRIGVAVKIVDSMLKPAAATKSGASAA